MNYIYGRYALALTWYKAITGNRVSGNTYIPETFLAPDEKAEAELLRVVKDLVEKSLPE